MIQALEENLKKWDIRYYNENSDKQGIVHVIAPEQGLTRPGMTIVCGDSHTATHGAFGAIAFELAHPKSAMFGRVNPVLPKLKVRKIHISGDLQPGVTAKDIVLKVIGTLGADAGVGYAYEYCGPTIEGLTMDERMTICNMSIEGARSGYVNPDQTTFAYLRERLPHFSDSEWQMTCDRWLAIASDQDASADDEFYLDVGDLSPVVTWGISDQSIEIEDSIPQISQDDERAHVYEDTMDYMGWDSVPPKRHPDSSGFHW